MSLETLCYALAFLCCFPAGIEWRNWTDEWKCLQISKEEKDKKEENKN